MNKAIAPSKFAHVVFRTGNFTAMKEWYCAVLNARVQFENPMIAFLTFDDEHHRVALVNMPGLERRSPGSAGLDHIAYTYPSLEALVSTYERLKENEIRPFWCVNHGPTTSMYYRDPDGNAVEFQVDNFPDVEQLNAWFHSGEFEKNPIGVNYDPDKLAEKFRAGVPERELIRQGAI